MKAVKPAADKLYGALDDEQKKVADELDRHGLRSNVGWYYVVTFDPEERLTTF